jgi:dipeptidase E
MSIRLLLLSNSRAPDGSYLSWARAEIKAFLGPRVASVHFIPYAAVPGSLARYDEYAQRVRMVFAEMGYAAVSLHEAADPVAAVRTAAAIVVGGGNTFHLLTQLHTAKLVELIAARARAGTPYIGWSAGSVVACATIATTNDMPIIEPPTLRALDLVPFQINAHYTDAHPPGHQGETRGERIAEFLTLQPSRTVIGLREGSLLHVEGDVVQLRGTGARIFRAGCAPLDWAPADGSLHDLVSAPSTVAAHNCERSSNASPS